MAWPSTESNPKMDSYSKKGSPVWQCENSDGSIRSRKKAAGYWRTATLNFVYRSATHWSNLKNHWLANGTWNSFTLPIWETGSAVNKTVYYLDEPQLTSHPTAHTWHVTVNVRFWEAWT